MSREEHPVRDHHAPKRSYRAIVMDIAIPGIYLVFAIIIALPLAVYAGTLVHIYVTPIFGETTSEIVSRHPPWSYMLNVIVMSGVLIASLLLYVRDSNDQ